MRSRGLTVGDSGFNILGLLPRIQRLAFAKELREDRLVNLNRDRVVQLLDWERLTQVAEFDPAYLQGAKLGANRAEHVRPSAENAASTGGFRLGGPLSMWIEIG